MSNPLGVGPPGLNASMPGRRQRSALQDVVGLHWIRSKINIAMAAPLQVDDLRRESGQASVPTAVVDVASPAVAAAAQGMLGAAAEEPDTSQAQHQQQQQQHQHQQLRRSLEPAHQASPRAGASAARAQPSARQQQQQLGRAKEAPQLLPSRPLADFLAAGASARSTRRGDSAFRVLCQVPLAMHPNVAKDFC